MKNPLEAVIEIRS